jgi:hypothetical protein
LRDIYPRFIAAVKYIAAELEKRGLTSDFALEWLQLQAADKHKVVVVVDGDVATVAVENASVVGQQVLLLGPNAREWFSPKFGTDLPVWRDCAGRQCALDREQGIIRSELLQAKWRFILADLDLCRRILMPVDPNICCGKSGPVT